MCPSYLGSSCCPPNGCLFGRSICGALVGFTQRREGKTEGNLDKGVVDLVESNRLLGFALRLTHALNRG